MRLIIFKIFVIQIIVFAGCLAVKAQDVPLIVVVNTKGPVPDLTFSQLKSVLRGERLRWKDGTKVVIALMKTNTPAGIATCKKIYNLTPNDLNKLFLALVFQGRGEAPVFFNSVTELETFISETPGAIGVVESSPGNKDRVIHIDGKESI